jgi:hypothetical protein
MTKDMLILKLKNGKISMYDWEGELQHRITAKKGDWALIIALLMNIKSLDDTSKNKIIDILRGKK